MTEPGWYTLLLFHDGKWQIREWEEERITSSWCPCRSSTLVTLRPYVWLSPSQRHVTGIELFETSQWCS